MKGEGETDRQTASAFQLACVVTVASMSPRGDLQLHLLLHLLFQLLLLLWWRFNKCQKQRQTQLTCMCLGVCACVWPVIRHQSPLANNARCNFYATNTNFSGVHYVKLTDEFPQIKATKTAATVTATATKSMLMTGQSATIATTKEETSTSNIVCKI